MVPTIDRITVTPSVIPTATPQSDGTFEWDRTTLVLVEAEAGGVSGLGYTYADTSTAVLIRDSLAALVRGRPAMDVSAAWDIMVHAVRNLGRPGIASMAIAAVDIALWDLTARLLDLPLVSLLGSVRHEVPAYGSGGLAALCEAAGIPLSAHTAPSLHAHLCCALTSARHVEYFFDHGRIEAMLFDGVAAPRNGVLCPDLSRPGFGLELKRQEAARYAA
jgi:L-alanine-DL-glutamate epimerase-like enolase superfamily enzyme